MTVKLRYPHQRVYRQIKLVLKIALMTDRSTQMLTFLCNAEAAGVFQQLHPTALPQVVIQRRLKMKTTTNGVLERHTDKTRGPLMQSETK